MTNHLAPSELVDFAEGTLSSGRIAHVDTCPACAAAARELRATLHGALAAKDEIPEPSPLFWAHLSSRVQDAIVSQTPSRAAWWLPSPRTLVPLAAFALVVAVLTTMLPRHTERSNAPNAGVPASTAAGVDIDRPFDPALDATTANAWDVLTSAAADLEYDAAQEAGMAVHPAAFDRAVQQLGREELTELGKLLQTELKRSSN